LTEEQRMPRFDASPARALPDDVRVPERVRRPVAAH
jgi:hypothetical protein